MPEKKCVYCDNPITICPCHKIFPEPAFGFFFFHTIYKDIVPMKTVISYVQDIEQQSKKPNSEIKTELFTIKPENCHWCGYHKDHCICGELTKNKDGLFFMLYNYIKYDKIPEEAKCQTK